MRKVGLVSIIDDDEVYCLYLQKVLEATNAVEEIITFSDGEAAANYFISNKENHNKLPDLVFLDLSMPEMNGWQFLDEIDVHKFSKKEMPIYICTSSTLAEDREKLISYSNLRGYLNKPLLKESMFRLLDFHIGE